MAAPSVAGAPVTALDATGTATALVFTKDPATAVGDLLVVQCAGRSGAAIFTPPAGWTRINDTTVSSIGISTFYRVADGTEGSTITFTSAVVARMAGGMVRVTGADPLTPVDVKSTNTGTAATSLVATGVTPASADTLLLAFYALSTGNGTLTVPAGMTQLWSFPASASGTSPFAAGAWLTLASEAPTGTKTAAASSAGNYTAQLVELQPPGVDAQGWGTVAI